MTIDLTLSSLGIFCPISIIFFAEIYAHDKFLVKIKDFLHSGKKLNTRLQRRDEEPSVDI